MDRGAWQATVDGVTRGGHNLATKIPPQYNCMYQSHNALYNYLDNTNVSENSRVKKFPSESKAY